jgi:hypothetical protein
MQVSFDTVLGAMVETVRMPRDFARRIIAMRLDLDLCLIGMVLTAVISAILTSLTYQTMNTDSQIVTPFVFANPILTAGVQLFSFGLTAFLIIFVGSVFGGKGTLTDAIALLVWIEVIMIAVECVQLVMLWFSPDLALIFGVLAIPLFFWMLSHFIAALHDFTSALTVFFGTLATAFAVSFALVVVLSMLKSVGLDFGLDLPNV